MLQRVIFIAIFIVGAVLAPGRVTAAAKDSRIAVLISYDGSAPQEVLKGLKAYLETQQVKVDYKLYPLNKDAAKASSAMQDISQQGADMIFALGSLALKAACQKDMKIPVVATMVMELIDLEKCANVTGVALDFSVDVQFEWLQRFLPDSKRIGVLYNPAENQDKIKLAHAAAIKYGLTLVPREVSDPKDLPAALDSLTNSADVLWGINDRLVLNRKTAKNILLFSFRNRIPFVGLSSAWVKAGAIYALDRDYADIGQQCGKMIQKALKRTAVAAIAAASPRKVVYSLNLKTVEQMKVDVNKSLVAVATKTF